MSRATMEVGLAFMALSTIILWLVIFAAALGKLGGASC